MVTEAFAAYLARNGVKAPSSGGLHKIAVPKAAKPWHINTAVGGASAPSASPSPPDFISGLLDLIDRPGRAVRQTAEALGEGAVDAAHGKLDVAKTFGNVASAPWRGLFSGAKSDQETSSQIIENLTDRAGKYDPKYKDTRDNVNPILKGVAGFVGDVALDPLTYVPIPIAPLLKGGKAAIAGAKGLADAAKAAKEAPAVEKAAAEVADVVPTVDKTVEAGPVAVSPSASGAGPEAAVTATGPDPLDALKVTPTAPVHPKDFVAGNERGQNLVKLLTEIETPKTVTEKAAPVRAVPESKGAWAKGAGADMPVTFKGPQGQVTLPVSKILAKKQYQNRSTFEQINKHYEDYAKGFAAPKDGPAPMVEQPDVVRQLTALDQFKAHLATEESRAALEEMVGGKMVGAFARIESPENFAQAISKVRDRLADFADVSKPLSLVRTRADNPAGALWDTLGIKQADAQAMHVAYRGYQAGGEGRAIADILSVGDLARERAAAGKHAVSLQAGVSAEGDVLRQVRATLSKDLAPDTEVYKHATATGIARDAEGIGRGSGIERGIDNAGKQSEALAAYGRAADVAPELKQWIKPDGKGVFVKPERAAAKREAVLARLRLHFATRRELGIPARMDYRPAPNVPITEKSFLDMHEVLSALSKENPQLVDRLFFHPGTGTHVANFEAGIARLVAGHPIEDVIGTIAAKTDQLGREIGTGKGLGYLAQDAPRMWQYVSPRDALKQLKGVDPSLVAKVGTKGAFNIMASPEADRVALAAALEKIRPHLSEQSAANAASYAERVTEDTTKLVGAEMERVQALVDSGDFEQLILRLSRVQDDVAETAKAEKLAPAASQAAPAALEEAAPLGAIEASTSAARSVAAATPQSSAKATGTLLDDEAKLADATDEELTQAMGLDEAVDAGVPVDLAQSAKEAQAARGLGAGILGQVDTAKLMFDQTHLMGKVGLWQTMHDGMAMRKTLDGNRREALSAVWNAGKALSPDGTTTLFDVAFRKLQATGEADDELGLGIKKLLATVLPLDQGTHSILSAPAFRTSKGLPDESAWHYLNAQMDQYDGLKGMKFDLGEAATAAGQRGGAHEGKFMQALASQWHTWDVTDPKQFILDLQRMTTKVAADASTARSAMRELKGFVHVGDGAPSHYVPLTASKSTSFSAFLPKGLSAEPEVAWGLQRMDQIMRESLTLRSPIGKFIQGTVDPLLQAWKRAITVLRPGHHIRNGIGDFTQTYWAEGASHMHASSMAAMRVLALKKSYQDVDLLRALESLGQTTIKNGETITSGKFGAMSADTLFEAASSKGLLPDAKVIDDLALAQDADSRWARSLNKVTFNTEGSKIGGFVHTITEARDHYQRMQHFLQVVMKAQKSGKVDMGFRGMIRPASQEELFRLAAEKVIRSHPDASLLTPFEYKYLRRIVPFYSWMRGALPFTLAHAMRYPGRATAFNKASYGLAVSMGVNPDSLADPFPADQLFPSFLTENVQGPQLKLGSDYFSFSPGFTMWDVPNTFADPVAGAAGMLNPLLRAPVELATGSKVGTQAKIKDDSDYVDQNLPGVNYLANMTGISPTGSIVSMLRGQGLDSQYGVAAGQKSQGLAGALGATNANVDPSTHPLEPGGNAQLLSLLSFLTGTGPANFSQPGYVNSAEIEKRNRAGDQAKTAR